MRCKYYEPWAVVFSAGYGQREIHDVCVDDDVHTIAPCCHTRRPEACPKYIQREPGVSMKDGVITFDFEGL